MRRPAAPPDAVPAQAPHQAADAAWRAALVWLAACPIVLPAPDIAVAGDGSVALRWQVHTRHAVASFDAEGSGELRLADGAFQASVGDVAGNPGTVRRILQILTVDSLR